MVYPYSFSNCLTENFAAYYRGVRQTCQDDVSLAPGRLPGDVSLDRKIILMNVTTRIVLSDIEVAFLRSHRAGVVPLRFAAWFPTSDRASPVWS
jgi:hypothetical protein